MAKSLAFHADMHRVTVIFNGQPLSLNAEVDVIIHRPTKLDPYSNRVWDQLSAKTAQEVTVDRVPGGAPLSE